MVWYSTMCTWFHGSTMTLCTFPSKLAQACEATPNCHAVCVDGGPVSRVESLMMDEIVRHALC